MGEEHNRCLICGEHRLEFLSRYSAAYLVRCPNCSFIFSKKIPSQQDLSAHYNQYPRHDYISPLTIKRYEELLKRFEPYRKLNRILDVGSGVGYFLQTAKGKNWEVYGTEYTDTALRKNEEKGIIMFKGALSKAPFDNNSFDIITSFEVIEHINNPKEEILKFKSLLRSGGIVYITTPNFNSIGRYILKEKYNIIEYPEHLSYYTPKTIHYLFTTNGFSKVRMETTGFSVTHFKRSIKKTELTSITVTTDDEVIRKTFEKNSLLKFVKTIVNFLLSAVRKGDTLKVIYKIDKEQ